MVGTDWAAVVAGGLEVPTDRPLADLTAELTRMLGSAEAAERDDTAYLALATWIERGVYDDLLRGLGDGMVAGLTVGLGEEGTDTVFRRSFSALVLGECLARDNARHLLPGGTVMRWGDRLAGWLVRERDVRGPVPGKGWAHAVAHGADALGALAGSIHLGTLELTVLLDVVADRVLLPHGPLLHREPDRLAVAVTRVLRRNLLDMRVLEPWVARIAASAAAVDAGRPHEEHVVADNAQSFLRALHLVLSLGTERVGVRSDLLLATSQALRDTNWWGRPER